MRFVIFLTLFCFLLIPLTIHSQSYYNENNKEGLRNFLRQPSSISGKSNFECIGLNITDTINWHSTEGWINKIQDPTTLVYIDWEWDNYIPANLIRLEIKSFDESNTFLSGTLDCSYFSELKELNCSNASIKNIDLSSSRNLETLNCSNNKLDKLDTENCGMLKTLNCSNNKLDKLDLSLNYNLSNLDCSSNQLSQLNVKKNIYIKTLSCSDNDISKLDIPDSKTLEVLNCSNNSLSQIDLSKHESLKLLSTSDNNFEAINISNNKELISLYSSENKIKDLNIAGNHALIFLNLSKNNLTKLNTSSNNALEYLYLPQNNIQSLNTATNTKLLVLNCSNNKLSELILTNNSLIADLNCSFNNIEAISTANTSDIHSFVCNDNSLRFSTLPLSYINAALHKLIYSPQSEIDGGEILYENPIDISKEYVFDNKTTTYNWIDENNNPVNMVHVSDGIFKASKNDNYIIFCEMENPAFPLLKLKYKVKTLKNDTTGIIDNQENNSLIAFYDKHSGYLHIIASEAIENIELFDTLGRVMLQEKQSENEVNILIRETIRNGVYVVRIKTVSGKVISKKINI